MRFEAEDGTELLDLPDLPLPGRRHARARCASCRTWDAVAARPRAPRADPARGAPREDLPHEDAAVDRDVPRRRRGGRDVAAGRRRSTAVRRTQPSQRDVDDEVASADGLLRIGLARVHAGPFIVFAEEAHEDSADLLFMPEATAADWATIFSHAEVRHIGAGLALVQAGEQDRALYLLTEGTVGVRLPRDEGAFKTIDAPVGARRAGVLRRLPALGDARRGHRRRGRAARRRRLRPPARARARRSRTRCCATSRASSRCACGWRPRSSPSSAAADRLLMWPAVVGCARVTEEERSQCAGCSSAVAAVAAGLIATPSADAAIPQVFTKTASPINCTVQASRPALLRRRDGADPELGRDPARRRGRVPARTGRAPTARTR